MFVAHRDNDLSVEKTSAAAGTPPEEKPQACKPQAISERITSRQLQSYKIFPTPPNFFAPLWGEINVKKNGIWPGGGQM
ncbi:MAG: hypothetical protein K2H58_03660, partial [Paramuribaculum sp.]|nr:hypothetical protein [Paramuribaculum sp.]